MAGGESVMGTGETTVILITEEVAETPPAVATAVKAYGLAARLPVVMPNGATAAVPKELPLAKKDTLVTEPLGTVAVASIFTFAGAAKTAPSAGLVIVTIGKGPTAAGVDRV